MEDNESTRLTLDDHWLLDHHIEELLGSFGEAASSREVEPDAVEEPFE